MARVKGGHRVIGPQVKSNNYRSSLICCNNKQIPTICKDTVFGNTKIVILGIINFYINKTILTVEFMRIIMFNKSKLKESKHVALHIQNTTKATLVF